MSWKSAEKEFLDFCDALYTYIYTMYIYIYFYMNCFTGKVYRDFIWRLPFLRNLGTSSHAALFPRYIAPKHVDDR